LSNVSCCLLSHHLIVHMLFLDVKFYYIFLHVLYLEHGVDISRDNDCDVSALSSSAARCLARETQMRQLVGASDGDIRPTSLPQEVSTPAENIIRLQECCQSPPECSQPQRRQSAAAAKPTQSKVVTEAIAVVTERLSWATDELRHASSIETCCQLCMLIRSCADAVQALQRVDGV